MMPESAISKPVLSAKRGGWLGFFRPAPPVPLVLGSPAEVSARYRLWQRRVLFSSLVGYAVFYFVRKNLGIAMPVMGKELGSACWRSSRRTSPRNAPPQPPWD
jgi:hypothetical protein